MQQNFVWDPKAYMHESLWTLAWPFDPKFDKYDQDNLFASVDDSSIPAELKKCNETQKNLHWLLILHTNFQH